MRSTRHDDSSCAPIDMHECNRQQDQRVEYENDNPLDRRDRCLAEYDAMPSRFEPLLDRDDGTPLLDGDDGTVLGDLLGRAFRNESQEGGPSVREPGGCPPQARATLCHCRPIVRLDESKVLL